MVDRKVNVALVRSHFLKVIDNLLNISLRGLQFGPDVTERFLKSNNLEYVVRSHEVKQEGYEIAHNGQLNSHF